MMSYYGVTQMLHGADHRWIFDEQTLSEKVYHGGPVPEEGYEAFFPYGGSNCSESHIVKLDSEEDIKNFLTARGDGPDVEDPMLVDLAEYYLRNEIGEGSCTETFLKKFGLDPCMVMDDRYLEAKRMMDELRSAHHDGLDYDDPFYGNNRDMRYSELCDLHKQVVLDTKYYLIRFDAQDSPGTVIRATHEPTLEELAGFCKDEVERWGQPLSCEPISEAEASNWFDHPSAMENLPVLGMEEKNAGHIPGSKVFEHIRDAVNAEMDAFRKESILTRKKYARKLEAALPDFEHVPAKDALKSLKQEYQTKTDPSRSVLDGKLPYVSSRDRKEAYHLAKRWMSKPCDVVANEIKELGENKLKRGR